MSSAKTQDTTKNDSKDEQRPCPSNLDKKDMKSTSKNLLEDARGFVRFGSVFRLVSWMYIERQFLLFVAAHSICTLLVWWHYSLYKWKIQQAYLQEADTEPNTLGTTLQQLFPPILYGSKHAILFQMFLLPLTMCRHIIAGEY